MAVWRGRRVLVTGHTGFKGSWLALWLHTLGAEVVGYALPAPTTPSNFELSGVRADLRAHIEADVRDFAGVRRVVREQNPEVIFHLAAQALVRESYVQPRETFEVNALGTANVLEAVRLAGGPRFVIVVTSDKCYAPRGGADAFREDDALGGLDLYSASKASAEHVASAYRASFFPPARLGEHGVRVATVRAGNVIGGGDWGKDRLVPDVVAHLAAGKAVPVRNPGAVRPWQHVLEPLCGYLLLGARLLNAASGDAAASDAAGADLCTAWNFGPVSDVQVTVAELVDRFIAAWGRGSWEDVSRPDQPAETAVLRLDPGRAIARLGWQPRWSLQDAIARTAVWYRQYHQQRGDMRAACLADIAAYGGSTDSA